jgi:long-chain fatty acid transport protein
MKKLLSGLVFLSISVSSFAAAYKIPEQSNNSMGTAAAYFAGADGADTPYYNPANLGFLDNRENVLLEIGTRFIYLPRINFQGKAIDPVTHSFVISDAKTKKEYFLVPYFHMVLPSKNNLRFGFSLTTPAGLSKRWSAKIPRSTAEEFTLKVFEFTTSAGLKISDKFSIGAGIRAVYATGQIKYQYQGIYKIDMNGDTNYRAGYVLSATVRPTKNLSLSMLYRSKVNLKVHGDAKGYLYVDGFGLYPISSQGRVQVPLPAEWRIGASYKYGKTKFEFTFDRTFWSKYENLNFNFEDPVVEKALGKKIPKNWHDTSTVRFGVIHKFSNRFTGMFGVAYDETPIPEKTLGFELPDSNGWIFSLGGSYKITPSTELGLSYLYFTKYDRNVTNDRINGRFTELSAHLFNISLNHSF